MGLINRLLIALGVLFSVAGSGIAFADFTSCDGAILESAFREPSDLIQKYERVRGWAEGDLTPRAGRPFLSLVIPAYREAARLPGSIIKIRQFLERFPLPVEVLAIIEKSPDNTLEVSREAAAGDPRIQVIDNQVQRGKGYAVRSGVLRAEGQIVLFMDADLSTPLYEIINFLDWMRSHPEVDVLIGDRRKAIEKVSGSRSGLRKLMTKTFHGLVQFLSPLHIEDTQAGFKAFRRPAARAIFEVQSLDHFAFDVELLILAQEMGMVTEALDIDWLDDRRSTVRPIVDPLKMLIDIVKVRSLVRRNLTVRQREFSL